MARTQFDIPNFTKKIEARLANANEMIGALAVSWAADRLRANGYSEKTPPPPKGRTGNLNNSLCWSTEKKQSATLGSVTQPRGRNIGGKKMPKPDSPLTVRVGSTVVYAARVEMGFVGKDSLGRVYNQAAKSYLRAGIMPKRDKIVEVYQRALNG